MKNPIVSISLCFITYSNFLCIFDVIEEENLHFFGIVLILWNENYLLICILEILFFSSFCSWELFFVFSSCCWITVGYGANVLRYACLEFCCLVLHWMRHNCTNYLWFIFDLQMQNAVPCSKKEITFKMKRFKSNSHSFHVQPFDIICFFTLNLILTKHKWISNIEIVENFSSNILNSLTRNYTKNLNG